MPKISIILPTYNVEPYIERALQSCINQTFKDIEIIVVDDCGNDKSIEIAKDYASKDERIKIIHNEKNLGLLRARYEGVKAAISDYIMFLDPDDYLELNACEECIKVLDNNEVDLICFNYKRFNDEGKIEEELYYKENQYNIIAFYDFLKSNFPYIQWSIWGKLLKKDKYLNAYNILNLKNDEKINIAEDTFLYMFYLPLCCLIKTLEQCLINYYISKNSLTNGLNTEKLFNIYKEHKILYNKMIQLKKNSKIRNKKYYYLFLISFERAMYNYYFKYLKITKQYSINFKIKKLLLKIKFFILEKIKI